MIKTKNRLTKMMYFLDAIEAKLPEFQNVDADAMDYFVEELSSIGIETTDQFNQRYLDKVSIYAIDSKKAEIRTDLAIAEHGDYVYYFKPEVN